MNLRKQFVMVVALVAAASAGDQALAQEAILFRPWAAAIKVSKGTVQVTQGDRVFPGRLGAKLKENAIVSTGEDGSVGLLFLDRTILTMGPNSEVVLTRYQFDPTTYLGAFDVLVNKGNISLQAGDLADSGPNNVTVTTPQAELKGNAKQLMISVGDAK